MGNIAYHNVGEYITNYNLKNYVETGTGVGECLSYVLQLPFENYHSIEIFNDLYQQAVDKFQPHENCKIHLGNSFDVVPSILPSLDGPILFFLDAHFPGSDFGFNNYDNEQDYNLRLPLEKELEVIKNNRDISKDVFIIDDLRIYEDGPFKTGNWKDRTRLGGDGIDFIYNNFESTHNITKDYSDQGYIILTPLNK
jgi:hypothetical protein